MFHERHSRTTLKSITWFIVGFLVTFGVLIIFTKDWKVAVFDAGLIQVIKVFFFYLHERLWNRSNYGQHLRVSK